MMVKYKRKSRIRETPNLSTDAGSSTEVFFSAGVNKEANNFFFALDYKFLIWVFVSLDQDLMSYIKIQKVPVYGKSLYLSMCVYSITDTNNVRPPPLPQIKWRVGVGVGNKKKKKNSECTFSSPKLNTQHLFYLNLDQ